MSQSKLAIFTRKTDGQASSLGLEYQKLRTLENWLFNRVHNVEEVIFCDYEDDIFQLDFRTGNVRFTQLKLYGSKPFSFKSEEITKAITHFFMLFSNDKYRKGTVEFVFETNTGIAKKSKINNSDLLKAWVKHQECLNDELRSKCAEVVKSIVTQKIKTDFKIDQGPRKEGFSYLLELPDSIWLDFTSSIKWIYNNEGPEKSVEATEQKIRALIVQLPFPPVGDQFESVFNSLYRVVSERSTKKDPLDRILTNEKINSLLLDLGDYPDKEYGTSLISWKGINKIKSFRFGEYFQVLNAANHCRHKNYLEHDSSLWAGLLKQYFELEATPLRNKLEAMYEYLWLKLRPQWLKTPVGSLSSYSNIIQLYFSETQHFDDHIFVEKELCLTQLVFQAVVFGRSEIQVNQIITWLKRIDEKVTSKLKSVFDPSERCYWLDLKASLLSQTRNGITGPEPTKIYDELISLLPNAEKYNVTSLSHRIEDFIEAFIELGDRKSEIKQLESLTDRLSEFANDRNGNHLRAKDYVSRGWKYIEKNRIEDFPEAFNCFHKAIILWQFAEAEEGKILGMLNIAQIYSTLGMHLIAKHYALTAYYISLNADPNKYAKRATTAMGIVILSEFRQGSWTNALKNFQGYLFDRFELEGKSLMEGDEVLRRTLWQVAHILVQTPLVAPEMKNYIEEEKRRLGLTYTYFLEPTVSKISSEIPASGWEKMLKTLVDSSPINDAGNFRTIEWEAYGSLWRITFQNTWDGNAIGEEFAAFCQAVLVEFSFANIDLHLLRTTIEIEVVQSIEEKEIEQLLSNEEFLWRIFSRRVDETDQFGVSRQFISMANSVKRILQELSVLSDEEIDAYFSSLFTNQSLAQKTLPAYPFQILYSKIYPHQIFDSSARSILKEPVRIFEPAKNEVLRWNDSLSSYYSREESIHQVQVRYENGLKPLKFTLENLKKQKGYSNWLADLRKRGFVDWQILMALFQFILNRKATLIVANSDFENEPIREAAFDWVVSELKDSEEKESEAIDFEIAELEGDEFKMRLNHISVVVLNSWGLKHIPNFPNLPGVIDFLRHRFNYGFDDLPELSPL